MAPGPASFRDTEKIPLLSTKREIVIYQETKPHDDAFIGSSFSNCVQTVSG
jgi:hypothetical protein